MAGKMLIIEESLSIKHKNGGINRQLYRINMFNTTSRIDACQWLLATRIHTRGLAYNMPMPGTVY
jgi:hypothetical protein